MTVAEVGVVEIGIAPVVRGLVYASPTVVEGFIKPAVVGVKGIVIPQMPFAKHARAVSRRLEKVRKGGFVGSQERAPANGVPDAGAVAVATGQEAGARRRTRGSHVKIGKPQAFGVQVVDVRRLKGVISMAAEIAISLVVRYDKYHVRFL